MCLPEMTGETPRLPPVPCEEKTQTLSNSSKTLPVAGGEITSVKRQPPAGPHLSCAREGKWRRASGAGGRGRALGAAARGRGGPGSPRGCGLRLQRGWAGGSAPSVRLGLCWLSGLGTPCSSLNGRAREVCKDCGKSSAN